MSIVLKPDGIIINGQPVIIRSCSLFYFRVPRGLWRDRMSKIRQAGYNAIDVYFPWNYHELSEGRWDFRGERDIAEFLHIAAELGLWLVARPGPYICSEWDGGGLPAYLYTRPGLRLRDNDSRYLRFVGRWMDRILSILEPFQMSRGGTVIAVQLENELDFQECEDRLGYMVALREMARERGISVPLFACAGQGDLRGATGGAPGILPAVNIYGEESDPGVEQRAFHYYQQLHQRGQPLFVPETNRSHFFLRRLLSAGAKLIGPYLQAGGTNFGFTQSVNNWGQPLSFIASDYDFNGMIGPDGMLREEFNEAILFNRALEAFGPALSLAAAERLPVRTLAGDLPCVDGGPYALAREGGGRLLALPNITRQARGARLCLDGLEFPRYTALEVEPARCPLLPAGIDLRRWGLDSTLLYATAELALVRRTERGLGLVFYADHTSEIALEAPGCIGIEAEHAQCMEEGSRITLCFAQGQPGRALLRLASGTELAVFSLDRLSAARVEVDDRGALKIREAPSELPRSALNLTWRCRTLEDFTDRLDWKPARPGARAPALEEMGFMRGYGWYRARTDVGGAGPVRGYLVEDAADVISLYAGGEYIATVAPGGGSAYLPAREHPAYAVDAVLARAEIWGHSNFSDTRLPALRLGSLRGLAGLVSILHERDLTPGWFVHPLDEAESKELYRAENLDPKTWPLVGFLGWQPARSPNRTCYYRTALASPGPLDRWVLHFEGLARPVDVSVNGRPFRRLTPLDPFLDISGKIEPEKPIHLVVCVDQDYPGQASGRVLLLEGRAAQNWEVAGLDEVGLLNALLPAAATAESLPVDFPARFKPGKLGLLWAFARLVHVGDEEHSLRFRGSNAKLTVFFNDRLVGRVWLDPQRMFPRVTGGAPDQVYLPAPWWQPGENRLLVWVEATHPNEPAEVSVF